MLVFDTESPSIFVTILAKSKALVLPFYLETLLNWTYPKSRMHLYMRTNDNNDETQEILEKFIADHGDQYLGITLNTSSIDSSLRDIPLHDWSPKRFNVLGHIRQESLIQCQAGEFDFYFVSDVDNFLIPRTLRDLVSLNLDYVGPYLLHAFDTDSFPPGIESLSAATYGSELLNLHYLSDENGFYKHSPIYKLIFNQNIKGIIEGDTIHCTYLIKGSQLKKLSYTDSSSQYEYMVFSRSAHRAGVKQYFDNRLIYGCQTLSENVAACRMVLRALEIMGTVLNSTIPNLEANFVKKSHHTS